ncbi:MAG TPA: hypothetical protein VNZ43_00125 [Sphingomonadaceae bacterium]|nr:hypothetical protein [Sphingomonadaceae bacterium]
MPNNEQPPANGRTIGDATSLRAARALMEEALAILDIVSTSPAAATLDLAIHQLDDELAR